MKLIIYLKNYSDPSFFVDFEFAVIDLATLVTSLRSVKSGLRDCSRFTRYFVSLRSSK
jgi:hypothetical protein